jgi:predicted DNA-binding transcriptional regulator YafY
MEPMTRRAERLFDIVQALRRLKPPVTAGRLAEELEVSLRTVYRDVAVLQATGVPISGAAGFGYVLEEGYDLPPLMLTEDEIEALLLGAKVVQSWADPELARAAADLLAKIGAVLPERLRPHIQSLTLAAPPSGKAPDVAIDVAALRRATRAEHKLRLAYVDERGEPSERIGAAIVEPERYPRVPGQRLVDYLRRQGVAV